MAEFEPSVQGIIRRMCFSKIYLSDPKNMLIYNNILAFSHKCSKLISFVSQVLL